MRIPEDKIEEIRSSVDIVDYINQFVSLKRVGKNYVGLCPFLAEKTPSFTVSPDKQLYHCFGCGAGGNVFNFIMQYEKVSFFEAVKRIAEFAGIELPKPERKDRWIETEFEELYEANRFAEEFFVKSLLKTSEGKRAMEYLYKRGVNDATIAKFGIGYSPDQWDALVQHAIKQGFSLELLEKVGVIIKKEDGSYYDRFRGRIIFPIFSITGRIIAFGGRRLKDDENIPKYINSPETKVYTKSKVLYGLYQGRDSIRKKGYAILVEGYMDCISLFQAGFENVVASGGTALTEEQVRLISNYTNTIYFIYDADSAGARAMMRGVDLILAQGIDVYIVNLPEGEDPDSFIKKYPVSEFDKLIENAVNFVEFKASTYQRLGKLDDPNVKVKAIRSIVESISKIPDALKRSVFIREISSKYKIPEQVLNAELEMAILRSGKETVKKEINSQAQTGSSVILKFKSIPAEEKDLAKIVLEKDRDVGYPVRCGEAVSHEGLVQFIEPNPKWIASTVRYFKLVAPDGTVIKPNIEGFGYILERRIFDYELAKLATYCGAEIVTKAYVNGLIMNDGKILTKSHLYKLILFIFGYAKFKDFEWTSPYTLSTISANFIYYLNLRLI